ncbi:MAG: glycoside hydrolase domain-containing protein, partial [Clostridium sp.]
EGIAGANGHFGPGTSSHCPVLKQGDNSRFVTILKYALYCNNQDAQSFTTSFDAATKSAVYEFQKFSGLNATGVADLQTWKSLLVSTGDNMRKGTACDCSTPVTQARANTLKANGYKYIGRYIAGGEHKRISIPEIELILKNGMKWFPIFQKSGNYLNYFNEEQGKKDGAECVRNASLYQIPNGSTIYFGVDFDAMDGDISAKVLPYFKGIDESFTSLNSRSLKIGVYGSRNVCSRVSDAGYAEKSFVSDMSTGFSGNLGFPLPKNWAFDQIREYAIGTGDGRIEIDNDIFSGRDNCINTLSDLSVSKQLQKLFGLFSIEVENPDLNYENTKYTENAIIQLKAGPKSVFGDGKLVISHDVKAGKFEMSILDSLLSMFSWIPVTVAIQDYLGDVATLIGEGSLSVGYTMGDFGLGLKAEVSQELIKIPELAGIADQASVIYACCTIFPKGFDKELKEFFELLKKAPKILAGTAMAVLIAFLVVSGAGLIAGASVGVAEFIGALITAVSTLAPSI